MGRQPLAGEHLLAVEAFSTLLEARVLVEDWRIEDNTLRPHRALGYLTPDEFETTTDQEVTQKAA
jgi:transposase InsO family protein